MDRALLDVDGEKALTWALPFISVLEIAIAAHHGMALLMENGSKGRMFCPVFKGRDPGGQTHLFPSPLVGPFSGTITRGPARLPVRAVPGLPGGPAGAPPLPLPRMLQPMLQSLWGLKRGILLWRRKWDYSRRRMESSHLLG